MIDRSSFTVRLFLIGVLVVILVVPLTMIGVLTFEREDRYHAAQQEISSKWGQKQLLFGPVLRIPHVDKKQTLAIFPETLNIETVVDPQVRSRGIFDVLLYTTTIKMTGTFPPVNSVNLGFIEKELAWQDAAVDFYLSDIKGLQADIDFLWNNNTLPLNTANSFTSSASMLQGRFLDMNRTGTNSFELSFPLQGSGELKFIPLGAQTTALMKSSWQYPSFSGAFLPTERELNSSGFSAEWLISQFRKNSPPSTIEYANQPTSLVNDFSFQENAFGVDFFFPTDFYQKTMRSVKYGILFVVFTFVAFFLFEVLHHHKVHPFQYLLVGISLSIFYLLLLSFSEHIGFFPAYLIASIATIAINTLYCIKIFHSRKKGLVIGAELTLLYGYLYFVINSTDYALLIGSISLFFVVALVMYLTRNINWYETQSA